MQIVQILKGHMPMNIGTVKSTIQPATISEITVGFVMPSSATTGTYTAQAFNWNQWIDQPGDWEAYSESASMDFDVI